MLVVIERVLDGDEIGDIRARLAAGDWRDGAVTAGSRSAAVKRNLQLGLDDPLAVDLGNAVLGKLGRNALFQSASLAEKIFPPMFSLCRDGGHYGVHVDSALMRHAATGLTIRSDLSATLFLSDPDEYEGGELVIEEAYGGQAVKLAAGDMVLYPSTSLHRVMPVTAGERAACVLWMQSAVADGSAREMLFDLDQSIQALSAGAPADDPRIERLIRVYHNLLRRWASV